MNRTPYSILTLVAVTLLGGCDLPRDPERSLEQARGGTLLVGAVAAPPHLERSDEGASGPEAELIRAFAATIDAEVEWRWGALDDHMEALARFELDVVAGGLTSRSPWKSEVGFTRPWRVEGDRRRVLAVAPGENALLVALERLIVSRTPSLP